MRATTRHAACDDAIMLCDRVVRNMAGRRRGAEVETMKIRALHSLSHHCHLNVLTPPSGASVHVVVG